MSQPASEAGAASEQIRRELPPDDDVLDEPSVDRQDASPQADAAAESDLERPEGLPLDQVFGILKNQRRRYVLQYLKEADGKVSLSDLAEQIAAWENEKEVKQISSSERKRVYVGLYQCHLPKMDGMDVVSFNKPRGIIEVGDNVDKLYTYIDIADEPEDPPWHLYSMALSGVGVVVLGSALVAQSFTSFAVMELAIILVVAAFAVYALVSVNWIRSQSSSDGDAVDS